jgi:chromosome segregation ATPase
MEITMKRNPISLMFCTFVVMLTFAITCTNTAFAAEKDKSARRAAIMMQKMKQDMQAQMDAEKATMQVQLDAQKKEFEDKIISKDEELAKQTKKLAAAERKNKNLENEIAKVTAEKVALDSKLQQTQSALDTTQNNLTELKKQYAQAQTDLKFNDGQRKTLTTNLAQTNKAMDECEVKNGKLHQFGTELIQIYDKPSNYDAAMRKEQFFQLKRVELENILQSKQDGIDDARFTNKKSAY